MTDKAKVKANLRVMEDGFKVLTINGHIIPGFHTVQYHDGVQELSMLTITLLDVEWEVTDMRPTPEQEEDRRRLVQEAFDDGRIIEAYSYGDPLAGWFEVHKSNFGPTPLSWTDYNFRLKGAKK